MCGYSGGGGRGHAWLLGGHVWLLWGGACVVALGGACVVAPGGACVGYDEIRSMSGRYASYWNAFLYCYNCHISNIP